MSCMHHDWTYSFRSNPNEIATRNFYAKNIVRILDCLDYKSMSKTQHVLFEGIVRWIMHNVPNRKDRTDVLLSLIDMSKLTAEYMMNYLGNVAHRDDLDGTIQQILSCYNTSKRLKNERRTVIILDNSDEKLAYRRYDLIGFKICHSAEQMEKICIEGRFDPAVAVLDEKLYACGGVGTKSVEVYEPATKSWRKVSSMNKQRQGFLVVAYEGKLFAIGGDTDKTVEVYDPVKDQWQIDQESSSGLQIEHPSGGLISEKCLRQRALKRPSVPKNKEPPNTGDDDREVPPPLKKIKN